MIYSSENAVLSSSRRVLIIDELQEVSQRHLDRLEMFANKAEHLMTSEDSTSMWQFEIIRIP